VPFDGVCVVTMDPATLLPTGEVVENGLPESAQVRMAEIETAGDDVNNFRALAGSGEPSASLSAATGGDLDRSVQHRELKRPNGFGDELRAVLVDDGATWGGLTLLRTSDRGPFSAGETALVGSLSRYLAEGVRRATLMSALAGQRVKDIGSAGLLLLAPDNSILRADAAAERWLDELDAASVPSLVAAVAMRARDDSNVARVRVRTVSGTWLLIRGSLLGDEETAVTIEPLRPHELAPLIADAYGLTGRERAVTQLVAQGLPTNAIAARLDISPWTVQDHLKAVFEKLGVSSRGEVVARVFFEHYAPRL
jgi:DNA-binding CsgD family transcriptional regulator